MPNDMREFAIVLPGKRFSLSRRQFPAVTCYWTYG